MRLFPESLERALPPERIPRIALKGVLLALFLKVLAFLAFGLAVLVLYLVER